METMRAALIGCSLVISLTACSMENAWTRLAENLRQEQAYCQSIRDPDYRLWCLEDVARRRAIGASALAQSASLYGTMGPRMRVEPYQPTPAPLSPNLNPQQTCQVFGTLVVCQ